MGIFFFSEKTRSLNIDLWDTVGHRTLGATFSLSFRMAIEPSGEGILQKYPRRDHVFPSISSRVTMMDTV